jgi:hypothetical protein
LATISSATCWAASLLLRKLITTGQPAAARRRATAFPIPRDAPVTNAYFIAFLSFFVQKYCAKVILFYQLSKKTFQKLLFLAKNATRIQKILYLCQKIHI